MMKLSLGGGHSLFCQPEQYGLTVVGELDYSSGDYEFDYRAVWSDSEGRLWTARDAGCSCPTPFENVEELDRLFSFAMIEDEIAALDPYFMELPDPKAVRTLRLAVEAAFKANA